MSTALGIRMKTAAHPGGFVKSEIVEALGQTVKRDAGALGVRRAALSACRASGRIFAGDGGADPEGVRVACGDVEADAE